MLKPIHLKEIQGKTSKDLNSAETLNESLSKF